MSPEFTNADYEELRRNRGPSWWDRTPIEEKDRVLREQKAYAKAQHELTTLYDSFDVRRLPNITIKPHIGIWHGMFCGHMKSLELAYAVINSLIDASASFKDRISSLEISYEGKSEYELARFWLEIHVTAEFWLGSLPSRIKEKIGGESCKIFVSHEMDHTFLPAANETQLKGVAETIRKDLGVKLKNCIRESLDRLKSEYEYEAEGMADLEKRFGLK